MKNGPLITAVVSVLAMTAVVTAFMSNASPYVTITQARTTSGNQLHLAGDLVKNSVHTDLATHTLTFRLKDKDGQEVTVEHRGEPPSNMSEVTRVVAVGSMQGDKFVSDQLLVKCPSKYDSTPKLGSQYQTKL